MWTETLQQQTRDYFTSLPFAMMKEFDTSRFGIAHHLEDDSFTISILDSKDILIFSSINEMISAGWAID